MAESSIPSKNDPALTILSRLGKDFVVVGKTRVHTWYAWLILGIVVGITLGIIIVANRSNESKTLEESENSPPSILSLSI